MDDESWSKGSTRLAPTKAKVVAPEFEAPKVKMTDKTGEETAEPVDRLMLGMGYWETRSWLVEGEEP